MDIRKEFLKQIPIEKASEEALLMVADKKKMRNYLVIRDFDTLMKLSFLNEGYYKINKIQNEVASRYGITARLVRMILSERRENQL